MMGVFMCKNTAKWTQREDEWAVQNKKGKCYEWPGRMKRAYGGKWTVKLGRIIRRCVCAIGICMCLVVAEILSGCSSQQIGSDKKESLDYTVVESVDVPVELQKLIDEKKANTLRLTFTTKDYTYIVAGYGTQQTSGYSIRVNDVYLGNNAVYADFTLIGPAASESVTEVKTTPYIVLKIEKRDESVVFNL